KMIIEVARRCSNAYSTTTMLNSEKIIVVMPAYNAARTLWQTYEEVMGARDCRSCHRRADAGHDDMVAIARRLDSVQVEVASGQPGLRGESKDLLAPRACCRSRHYHHDSSGLSVRTPTHPGNGDAGREPPLSMCTCVADSRRRRVAGRNAVVEIRRESVPYVRGESSPRRQAFQVPHRPSCIYTEAAGTATLDTNSDDFVFDNQVLAQVIALGCAIGEVTCPARYLPEASS